MFCGSIYLCAVVLELTLWHKSLQGVCAYVCVRVCLLCRTQIRALCRSKAEPRVLLAACDKLRDDTLVDLGVRLEDRPDGERDACTHAHTRMHTHTHMLGYGCRL